MRYWNSKRPLVFAHIFLTKMLGIYGALEIKVRIASRMYLWERGLYAGLVGDAEAESAAREVRTTSVG